MKFFTNKSTTQKIIIMAVVVILFNFIAPNVSQASVGGILFTPIKDLLLAMADGIVYLVQNIVFGQEISLLHIEHKDAGFGEVLGWIVGGIAAAIVVVVAIIGTPFTGGASLAAVCAVAAAVIGSLGTAVIVGGVTKYAVTAIAESSLPKSVYLPIFTISPQEIFANKIALLDVNFFNPNKYENLTTPMGGTIEQGISTAKKLQAVVAGGYNTTRTIAIVGLLIILLYTAIRIIISSSSQDKAKYKQRLLDWLVAMCLVFFMHYIMNFAVTAVEMITEALNSECMHLDVIIGTSNGDGEGKKLKDFVYEGKNKVFGDNETANALRNAGVILPLSEGSDAEMLMWPTNLMGKARLELQLEPEELSESSVEIRQFGFTVIYLVLVVYTVMFLFIYLKRLLILAFLTMIAPLMAMTYPLDKMHDGSAQGLNAWFKEYIFNLLIQPVHLLLYTILVGSAIDFVQSNGILYGLAAIGFLLPAEKLLRKFFGFEKSSAVGGTSALGGALAMQGINQLRRLGGGSRSSNSKNGGDKQKTPDKTRFATDRGNRDLIGDVYGNNDNNAERTRTADNQNPDQEQHQNQEIPERTRPNQEDDKDKTPQQRMLDAYNDGDDEWGGGFGTSDWDPFEQEALSREAYADNNQLEEEYDEDNGTAQQRMLDAYNDGDDEMGGGFGTSDWDPFEQEALSREAYADNNQLEGSYDNNQIREANDVSAPEIEGNGNVPEIEIGNQPNAEQIPNDNRMQLNSAPNKPKRSVKGTIKGVARIGGKVLASGVRYTVPAAAKLAIRGTVAGAATIAAGAAALATDNYGNVPKYMAAGAASGWVGGKGIAEFPERITKKIKVPEEVAQKASQQFRIDSFGAEGAREIQARQEDKAAMKDKERIQLYKEEFKTKTKAETKKIMEQANTYRQNGIYDDKIIIKSMQADSKKFGDASDSKERLMLAKLATQVNGSSKELEAVEKGLKKRNIPDADVKKYTDEVRDMFKLV